MSRIGKQPINVPGSVKVEVKDKQISVQGPKGKLLFSFSPLLKVKKTDSEIVVERTSDEKIDKSIHGTTRAIINNMVIGVTEAYKKELEIVGVGYKAQMQGKKLVLRIGFSHPIEIEAGSDLNVSTPQPNRILIEGIDKKKVGQLAANIRKLYPPEPYKGKGIRYAGEFVRKKLGKAMAK